MQWGILGAEHVAKMRRVRTLNLGSATRRFNSLAVPGISSVAFGKQLLLATLGVKLADELTSSYTKIQVANAVEALASWVHFTDIGWDQPGSRARGRYKLPRSKTFSFKDASKPSTYVTQPWRMRSGEAVRSLHLVDSKNSRFSSFSCNDHGQMFINKSFGDTSNKVLNRLIKWVRGTDFQTNNSTSRDQINISNPLSIAGARWLRDRMFQTNSRIKNAYIWLDHFNEWDDFINDFERKLNSEDKPAELSENHWKDIVSGSRYFDVCYEAESVLQAVEEAIGLSSDRRLNSNSLGSLDLRAIRDKTDLLQEAAHRFNEYDHDPTDNVATNFCDELTVASHVNVIENLVRRDGDILQLDETGPQKSIVPGPVFGTGISVWRSEDTIDKEEESDVDGTDSSSVEERSVQTFLAVSVSNLFNLVGDLNTSVHQRTQR